MNALGPYHTMGLPDESFLRDEVPMTKSEIRGSFHRNYA